MKFSALNKEASNSGVTPARKGSKPTKEAQESACLQLYRTALKCQQDGKLDEAKSLYQEILDSEVLQEVSQQGHAEGASVETSPVLKVKYLTYKNIATIAREQGDFSAALEAYIQASSIDGSEVVLWCQMASSAVSLGNLLLARKAFEQALRCNDGYWPAIEGLSGVLFALDDYRACLLLLVKVLNTEPEFPRGIAYVHCINERHPELISTLPDLQIHLMTPWLPQYSKYLNEASEMKRRRRALCSVDILQEPITPPSKPLSPSVGSLGRFLLATYHQCQQTPSSLLSCAVPVDLSHLTMEQSVEREESAADTSAGCLTPSKAGPSIKEGSQLPLEDAGSGEEMGRRDLKRKSLDVESYLAPKRRSMRVKSKQQEPTVRFGTLEKYIPQCLRQCMMAELTDLSPLKKPPTDGDESVKNADNRIVALLLEKTKQLPEPETVLQFVEQHKTNSGVINLMYQFVLMLAKQYDQKWSGTTPLSVSRVFIEVYEVLHKHLVYPSPFCLGDEEGMIYAQQLAAIALCYVELSIDAVATGQGSLALRKAVNVPSSSSDISQKSFRECVGFVQLCGAQILGDEIKVFGIRVSWALARWRAIQGDNAAATLALRKCQQDLEAYRDAAGNGGAVYLCNQHGDQVISLAHIAEKLKLIEQSVSLDQVTQMFNRKDYLEVVKQLSTVLMQEAGSISEFLIGSEKSCEDTGLSILLRSLINLGRIKECVECCIQALHALLVDYRIGNEHWIQALRFIFVTLEKHLDTPLLDGLELKAVRQLLLCVLKTIDVTCDITEPMLLLLMPICIPWKMFYIIISSNWQGKTDGETRPEEEGVGVAMDTQSHAKAVETMKPVESSTSLVSVIAPTATIDQPTHVNVYHPVTMNQAVTLDTTTVDQSLTAATVALPTEVAMDTTQEAAELPSSPGRINPRDSVVPALPADPLLVVENALVEHTEPMEVDTGVSVSVPVSVSTGASTVTRVSSYITMPTINASLLLTTAAPIAVTEVPTSTHTMTLDTPTTATPITIAEAPTSTYAMTLATPPATPITIAEAFTSRTLVDDTGAQVSLQQSGHDENHSVPSELNEHPLDPSAVPLGPTSVPCEPSAVPLGPTSVPCEPSAVPLGPLSTTEAFKDSSPSGHLVQSSSEKHEELKLHLQFLKEAHDYLGNLGWCCKDDGCFLQASVDTFRGELQILSALPPKHRDILLQELEQCYYCLYGHPQKKAKARGLAEHNAEQVPLTWDGALKLTEYFHCPYSSLSEVKNTYITPELLVLYKRITDVLPQEGKAHVFNALTDYIDGKVDCIPSPVSAQPHNSLIAEIFHILGDDSLKNQDNAKAIHYYQNSLCYMPDHFEAWTGLALSYSEKIYKQLDMRDSKASLEKFLQKHVQQTVRCFEKAVALNAQSSFVLEKFGFLCYTVQSFVSQIVKQRDLFPSDNTLLWATSMRTKMLAEAERCFLQATKLEKSWSSSLMLGKISYKLMRPASATLEHFADSAGVLHRQGALYPTIVEQGCKGRAMEAIEVHYQLYACALKILIQSKDKEMEEVVREALSKAAHLPLSTVNYPRVWEWVWQLSRGGALLSPSKEKAESGEDKMEEGVGQDLDVEGVMESSDTGGIGSDGGDGGDCGKQTIEMESSDTNGDGGKQTIEMESSDIGGGGDSAVSSFTFAEAATPPSEKVQCVATLIQGTERVPVSLSYLPTDVPGAVGSMTLYIPRPPSLPAFLFDDTSSMSSPGVTSLALSSPVVTSLALSSPVVTSPSLGRSSSYEVILAPLKPTPLSSAPYQSSAEGNFSEPLPPAREILLLHPEPLITETGSGLVYENITLDTTTPLLVTSSLLPQSSAEKALSSVPRPPVWEKALSSVPRPPVWEKALSSVPRPPVWEKALSSVPRPPAWENTSALMEAVLSDTIAHSQSEGVSTHSSVKDAVSLCATRYLHSLPQSSVTTGEGETSVLSLTPQEAAVAMVQESETAPATAAGTAPEAVSREHGSSAVSSTPPVTPPHHLTHISAPLLEQCLYNIAVCSVRCPAYFKPLYRLALVLDKMGLPKVSQQPLLGPIPSQLLEMQEKLAPLFVLRSNVFTNQWQVPVEEINRPGTFSTHARKNLELLVNILVQLGQTSTLAYLCAQLKTRPDATKQYLRDNERVAMFKKVWGLCLTTLKATYDKEVSTATAEKLGNLLMEVYNLRIVALRVDSQYYTKSSDAVLQSIYTSLLAAEAKEAMNEGNPPAPSLEEATKYCQARLKRAQAAAADGAVATPQSTCVSSTAN